jgi:uncharacterized protein (DUF58 family)
VAAQFCGLLGTAALANNDRIGLLQFSHDIDEYLPPLRGRSQLMRCLSTLLMPANDTKKTNIKLALKHLSELSLKRSILILVSDFFSDDNYQQELAILAQQHELLAVAIDDPKELALPKRGLFQLSDSENKHQKVIDFKNDNIRQTFSKQMQQRIVQRDQQFSHSGVDLLSHTLGDDPVATLLEFFETKRLRTEGETGG